MRSPPATSPCGRPPPAYAEQVYAKARAGYHPLTQQVVEGIIAKAKQAK